MFCKLAIALELAEHSCLPIDHCAYQPSMTVHSAKCPSNPACLHKTAANSHLDLSDPSIDMPYSCTLDKRSLTARSALMCSVQVDVNKASLDGASLLPALVLVQAGTVSCRYCWLLWPGRESGPGRGHRVPWCLPCFPGNAAALWTAYNLWNMLVQSVHMRCPATIY